MNNKEPSLLPVYIRNIKFKLFLLRFLFIIGLTATILLFKTDNSKLAHLLISSLFFISFIPVSGLKICSGFIQLKEFFFFGLFQKKVILTKDEFTKINLFKKDVKISNQFSTNSLFDIIFAFIPFKAKSQGITTNYIDSNSNSRNIEVVISDFEFELLQKILVLT